MKAEGIKKEKITCIVFGVLCAWSIFSYFFETPKAKSIPAQTVPKVNSPAVFADITELPGADYFLNSGRGDIFTYAPLCVNVIRTQKPKPKTAVRPRNNSNSKNSPQIMLPPKKMVEQKNEQTDGNKEIFYVFPLDVIGFVKNGDSGRMVIVSSVEGGEYRRMKVGDEWLDVKVLTLSDDTVVFQDELGRRKKINVTMFGKTTTDYEVEKVTKDTAKEAAVSQLPSDLQDKLKGAIGPDGKPDIGKALDLLQKMTPEEREKIMDIGKDLLF